MPLYQFTHSKTGETHEVAFRMNDNKVYNGPDGKQPGQWKRVFLIPEASFNVRLNPNSSRDFVTKLEGKKETLGSMWDRSAELSAKRAEKNDGVDPVKEQYYANYSKTRRGAKHPGKIRQEAAVAAKEMEKKIKKVIQDA